MFFYEEKTFYFGTLLPCKSPEDGFVEKFKITNPNKIPCNVKFDVKTRRPNEPLAFEIAPVIIYFILFFNLIFFVNIFL